MNGADFLPQFAASAVVDLERTAKHPAARAADRRHAEASGWVADMLRESMKIVLPDNGEIYRPNWNGNSEGGRAPSDDECDSFIMPAPVASFEYRWTHPDVTPEGKMYAPRRIVLTLDLKHGQKPPDGYVTVVQLFSIWYATAVKTWNLHPWALQLAVPLQAEERSAGGWGVVCGPCADLSDRAIARNTPSGGILSEFMGDLTALVQFAHAVRAGAHLSERREASATRRQRFQRKGVGGFTYHALELPAPGRAPATGEGGSHASPRLHVRRAHIRKLPSGSLAFVRSCLVGSAQDGMVHKSYFARAGKVSHES